MNKGLRVARGEWLLFLNADDELADGAAAFLCEAAREPGDTQWIQGNVVWIDPEGTQVGRQQADARKLGGLRRSTKFNQQAALMHRSIFESYGGFDESFRYVMDYDFWLRVYRDVPPRCFDVDIARYRMHWESLSRSNVWPAEREKHDVRMKNRASLPGMTSWESWFYVAATYWRSPTIAHYLAVGAARRGDVTGSLRWAMRNWLSKPVQSPEHAVQELREIFSARSR
jgi:GT2 family glycosyltransferase